MTVRIYQVLFLCTGNSARSILAEAVLNHLGDGRFQAWSAGSHPTGQIHPQAIATLNEAGISTAGYRSKSWDEFAGPAAQALDFVFTVCDRAAGEVCPHWPGQPLTAHWGVVDPAALIASESEIQRAFWHTMMALRRRIELFLSLPLAAIDSLTLQTRLAQIGRE